MSSQAKTFLSLLLIPLLLSCSRDPIQKTVFEELSVQELNYLYEQYPESEKAFRLVEDNRDLFRYFTKTDSAKFLKLTYSELHDFCLRETSDTDITDNNEELDINNIDFGYYESSFLKDKADEYEKAYPIVTSFWKRLDSFDGRRGILMAAFPEAVLWIYDKDAF